MSNEVIVLFGGTGFIGRALTKILCRAGKRVRIVSRQPHRKLDIKLYGDPGQIQILQGNLRYPNSIQKALKHADAAVNLVGLLYEHRHQTFQNIHVEGAKQIAESAAQQDLSHLIHFSALGADPNAPSHYAATKGQAESLVKKHFPKAAILRPSLVYGPEDHFFNRFTKLADRLPVLPLIGGGKTRFQPVYVNDLAQAVLAALEQTKTQGNVYEIGGETLYSFKELITLLLMIKQQRRVFISIPWPLANIMGAVGEILGLFPFIEPFLTRDQVRLLKSNAILTETPHQNPPKKKNSIQTQKYPVLPVEGGLKDLGILPKSLESILPSYLFPANKREFPINNKDIQT